MARNLTGRVAIVANSLRRHVLSTTVTVLSAALASGLVMAVFSISQQATYAFRGGAIGFDAVLGARGSALQLVMNTVYHLDTSPGNIPWSTFEEIAADPRVRTAVPYAVGDSYRGHRIVGTTLDLFTAFEPGSASALVVEPPGRLFDPERREVVVGATAARALNLHLNDSIQPSHGIDDGDHGAVHDEDYAVVGILEPSGIPSDRVLWIPIEGMYHMEGHYGRDEEGELVPVSHEHGEHGIPEEHREVSAVMLDLVSGQAGFALRGEINRKGTQATLAWPIADSIAQLVLRMGWIGRVLELVAVLVVAVAGGSLLASLYNAMNERRREFAVLRALGARRRTVFGIIVLEAVTIAALGAALGYAVYFAILFVARHLVRERTGVVLQPDLVHPSLYWTPVAMLAMGALAGLLPAWKAYRTDVASSLAKD